MSASFDPYHKWLGIPPKDQPPNHYRLLGIERFEDDAEVIEAAANRVMAYLHEVAAGDASGQSQTLLNEISAARICLLNQRRKTDYDQKLKADRHSAPPPENRAVRATTGRPTVGRPTAGTTLPADATRQTSSVAPRKRTWIMVLGVLLAIGLLGGIVGVIGNAQRGTDHDRADEQHTVQGDSDRPAQQDVARPAQQRRATLLLDWPPTQRLDATLTINGTACDIPANGDIAIPLKAGAIKLCITRPGYEDVPWDHVVARGECVRYSPVWEPKKTGFTAAKPGPPAADRIANAPATSVSATGPSALGRGGKPSVTLAPATERPTSSGTVDLPSFLDLPLRRKPVAVARTTLLRLSAHPRVTLRLVGGEAILTSAAFQLTPRAAGNDPRTWVVDYVDRKRQRTEIAEFILADATLDFRWLVDPQLHDADQLRNALLEINTGKQVVLLPLRQPAVVKPLVLSGRTTKQPRGIGSNGIGHLKISLDTLPEIANLRLELTGVSGSSSFAVPEDARRVGPNKDIEVDLGDGDSGYPLLVQISFQKSHAVSHVIGIQYQLRYLTHDIFLKPLSLGNIKRDVAWVNTARQRNRASNEPLRNELLKRDNYCNQLNAVASGATELVLHYRIVLPIEGNLVVLANSDRRQ